MTENDTNHIHAGGDGDVARNAPTEPLPRAEGRAVVGTAGGEEEFQGDADDEAAGGTADFPPVGPTPAPRAAVAPAAAPAEAESRGEGHGVAPWIVAILVACALVVGILIGTHRSVRGQDAARDATPTAETTAETTPETTATPAATPIETAAPEATATPTEANEPEATATPTAAATSEPEASATGATGDTHDAAAQEARRQLEETIDEAEKLVEKIRNDPRVNAAGRVLADGVSRAVSAGREALEDSGIQDSRYYKAAQATIEQAVSALNSWIDAQAAKAT